MSDVSIYCYGYENNATVVSFCAVGTNKLNGHKTLRQAEQCVTMPLNLGLEREQSTETPQ